MKTFLTIGLVTGFMLLGGAVAGQKDETVFNHSGCQYPFRTTNPIDGCDNTDPCDPLSAAKGGSGDCADAPLEKVVTPIQEPAIINCN